MAMVIKNRKRNLIENQEPDTIQIKRILDNTVEMTGSLSAQSSSLVTRMYVPGTSLRFTGKIYPVVQTPMTNNGVVTIEEKLIDIDSLQLTPIIQPPPYRICGWPTIILTGHCGFGFEDSPFTEMLRRFLPQYISIKPHYVVSSIISTAVGKGAALSVHHELWRTNPVVGVAQTPEEITKMNVIVRLKLTKIFSSWQMDDSIQNKLVRDLALVLAEPNIDYRCACRSMMDIIQRVNPIALCYRSVESAHIIHGINDKRERHLLRQHEVDAVRIHILSPTCPPSLLKSTQKTEGKLWTEDPTEFDAGEDVATVSTSVSYGNQSPSSVLADLATRLQHPIANTLTSLLQNASDPMFLIKSVEPASLCVFYSNAAMVRVDRRTPVLPAIHPYFCFPVEDSEAGWTISLEVALDIRKTIAKTCAITDPFEALIPLLQASPTLPLKLQEKVMGWAHSFSRATDVLRIDSVEMTDTVTNAVIAYEQQRKQTNLLDPEDPQDYYEEEEYELEPTEAIGANLTEVIYGKQSPHPSPNDFECDERFKKRKTRE